MFLRFTLLFAFAYGLLVNEGFAGHSPENSVIPPKRLLSQTIRHNSPPIIVEKSKKKKNKENLSPLPLNTKKVNEKTLVSSPLKGEPSTPVKPKKISSRLGQSPRKNRDSDSKISVSPSLDGFSTADNVAQQQNKPIRWAKRRKSSSNTMLSGNTAQKKRKLDESNEISSSNERSINASLTEDVSAEQQKKPRLAKRRKLSVNTTQTSSPNQFPPQGSAIIKEKRTFKRSRDSLALILPPVPSPVARTLLLNDVRNSGLFEELNFNAKVVHCPKNMIHWDDLVLTKSKKRLKLKTNKKIAQSGGAAVAYKGISHNIDIEKLDAATIKNILKKQKKYAMQLHHLTQKGEGTKEDPYILLTQACHMGTNYRYIIREDENGKREIVHSGLSKEEAQKLCGPREKILTNLLHFRRGNSLINRETFAEERKRIWKDYVEHSAQTPPKARKNLNFGESEEEN